jgi:hypothetical protein
MKTTTLFLMLAISLQSFCQFHITDSSHSFKIGQVDNIGNTGQSVALSKKVTDKSVYTMLYKRQGVADLYVNFAATKAEIESLYNLLYSMFDQPENSIKTVSFKLSVFSLEASNGVLRTHNTAMPTCVVNINGAKFTLTKKELKTLFGK